MSELSKRVNRFFDTATKSDIVHILENTLMSDHLKAVFEMKYIQEHDINYIAYKTGYSKGKIESDLRKIRKKLSSII